VPTHTSQTVTDTANATNTLTTRTMQCIVDSAGDGETVDLRRGAAASDTANATNTLEGRRGVIYLDAATGSETTILHGRFLLVYVDQATTIEALTGKATSHVNESGNATETVTGRRGVIISESAAGTDTPLTTLHGHITLSDSAAAVETVLAARVFTIAESATASEIVTLVRGKTLTVLDTANATSTVTAGRHTSTVVSDHANGSEIILTHLHAVLVLVDSAFAEEMVNTSDPLQQLWANTMTGAAAHWSGLAINSIVEMDGKVYAATAAGMVELQFGQGVALAEVLWDLVDLKSPFFKRVDVAYVGGSADAPLRVSVTTDQGRFEYDTHTALDAQGSMRAQLGKGLNARYWRFGVSNPDGTDFVMDDLTVDVRDMKNRR
jgi:frataxin-like iron-binding protein CyaY